MINYYRYIREAGGLGDSLRVMAVGQGLKLKYPESKVHYFGANYLRSLIAPRGRLAFDLYIPCYEGKRGREQPLNSQKWPYLSNGLNYKESHDCWCWAYLHEPKTHGVCCQSREELWCNKAAVPITRPVLIPTAADLLVRDTCLNKKKSITIGIQPGATCRSREWPYSYWNILVGMLIDLGVEVTLFDVCKRWQGEITDKRLKFSIARSWPDTIGKLLSLDLLITPDSGFYHLGGCLSIKTLGIFGCTSGQIMTRIWKDTHTYIQLAHDQIDYDKLPKKNGCNRPCKPICYQRWERGWDADRYRKNRDYCAIMKQITPHMVFDKITTLLSTSL